MGSPAGTTHEQLGEKHVVAGSDLGSTAAPRRAPAHGPDRWAEGEAPAPHAAQARPFWYGAWVRRPLAVLASSMNHSSTARRLGVPVHRRRHHPGRV